MIGGRRRRRARALLRREQLFRAGCLQQRLLAGLQRQRATVPRERALEHACPGRLCRRTRARNVGANAFDDHVLLCLHGAQQLDRARMALLVVGKARRVEQRVVEAGERRLQSRVRLAVRPGTVGRRRRRRRRDGGGRSQGNDSARSCLHGIYKAIIGLIMKIY
ncbi:MAG: hypothetical protein IPM40_14665 [Gammaproteobacteria bacterium]|nr:hypothetical protein [Gammaproteobacteria bacterium]